MWKNKDILIKSDLSTVLKAMYLKVHIILYRYQNHVINDHVGEKTAII